MPLSKQVIDLGAGSGLCAIAAGLAGASDVLAVDVDPFAGYAMVLNAARQQGYSMRTTTDDILDRENRCRADLLLIGDLFYEQRAIATRSFPLRLACASSGAEVLIGDPRRSFLSR